MTTSEAAWHELYNRLGEAIGEENADTLMSQLSDSATKSDLDGFKSEMRSDMAGFKSEMRSDMAEFKSEMRSDMAEFKSEMRSDMAELRSEMAEFKSEMRSDMAEIKEELRHMGQRLDRLTAAVAAQGRANAWTVASSMVGLTAIFTFILALLR